MRAFTIWIIGAGAALAEPLPGFEGAPEPAFFSGLYEVVGQGPEGAFYREPMRLGVSGQGLDMLGCELGTGRLGYARIGEALALAGQLGGTPIRCLFMVDPDNVPLLACANPDGLRLTLWPQAEFAAPLICP